MRTASLAGFLFLGCMTCTAQEAEFEAASVRPARPGAAGRTLTQTPGGRLSASNATLKSLIAFAYQVLPEQVLGGPAWLGSDGFDLEAKAPRGAVTQEQFRQMLLGVLRQRFHFSAHRDTRELPVYLLTVAKSGARLADKAGDGPDVGMRMEGPGEMRGVHATMTILAATLTRNLRRKVVDQTGLKGAYTFQLQFLPEGRPGGPGVETAPVGDRPSIFTALQEQLGLSLKAGKAPVDVVVVDRAEKPTEN